MAEDRDETIIDDVTVGNETGEKAQNEQEYTQEAVRQTESNTEEQYKETGSAGPDPIYMNDDGYNPTPPPEYDYEKDYDGIEYKSVDQPGPVVQTAENTEYVTPSIEVPEQSSAPDKMESVAANPFDTMEPEPGAPAKKAPASAAGNEESEKMGASGGRYVVSDTLPPLELPKGFAMDTPGILTCTEPVTAESIRALKAFVDEHHAELVMTGKWADPTVISFSPHDPVTGQRTTQKLDSELAKAVSDAWAISRLEARAGSVELVLGPDGKSPLDELTELSHIHMWGGFAFAGDVEVQRRILMSSHPMHVSVGITGDENKVQEGLLTSVEKLGVYINGSDGTLNVGANALAMDAVFKNEGPGTINRRNKDAQTADIENIEPHKLTDTEYVHIADFRDSFQKAVTQIDMGNRQAVANLTSMLDGLDGVEERFKGVSVAQSYKAMAAAYFGMYETESAKMDNEDFAKKVAERLTRPLVKDFDSAELIKALTNDNALDTAGVSTEKTERNKVKGAIKDAVDGLRKASALPPAEQDRDVSTLLASNAVFTKLLIRGGIAGEIFDTTRRDMIAAIRQMPDTMFAEMKQDENGKSVLKGFRFMNTSDGARHAAVQRDQDSQAKGLSAILAVDNRLKNLPGIPSTEKKEVRKFTDNFEKLLDKAVKGGTELYLSKMSKDALKDAKASQEMYRGGDGQNVGHTVALHTSAIKYGTGAFAGTDARFYGESEVKSSMMIKTASEMLEQIRNLDSHIVAISNNYARKLEENHANGAPVNAATKQKAQALNSIKEQIHAEGAGSLIELWRNTSNNITTLRKNAEKQKEIFNQAHRMAMESGMSPRDFDYIQRAVDKAVRENDTDSLGKDNPITSMLITYSEMQKDIEDLFARIKTGMSNVYNKLGDTLVPKTPARDEDGNEILDESGNPKMVPMFPDAEDRREFTNELFSRFNGVEPYVQAEETVKGSGFDMVVDIEAKWLTFKHYAGLDGKDPQKLLVVQAGSEFGRGSLQGSGIEAVEGKREFVDKHEYDELYRLHNANQMNTSEALKGVKEELRKMGVEVKGGLSDWPETFKPAFEQVLSDESLQPETKERLKCLAEKCCIACKSLQDSQEWLSKNSDFKEYRLNKSPQGAEINRSIERIKKDLAREGLAEPQRIQLENALKQKQAEKDELMKDGLNTKCHGFVSDEVKNVDLDYTQPKGEPPFPKGFNDNGTKGDIKKIDPNNIDLNSLEPHERLRGLLMEYGEATAAITTDLLKNYHHMTVSESVANVLLLGASIVGKWGKKLACAFRRESLIHDINKGVAWNQLAPLIDPANNPVIVFKDDKGWLSQNVTIGKYSSAKARKACKDLGISVVNGGRTIEVDMAKLSAGKYTGTVTFNAETLRMQTLQKQIPRYADKENIAAKEKLLNDMDIEERDRVLRLHNTVRKKQGKELIPTHSAR